MSSETRQHQKVLISEDAENVNKKTVKTFQTWMLKQTLKHNTIKVPLKSPLKSQVHQPVNINLKNDIRL